MISNAVDIDDGARDVGRQVGCEEQIDAGDILALPSLPSGMPLRISYISSVSLPPVMSVSIRPGVTQFTRMPSGLSSRAMALARPSTPALAAEQCGPPKMPPPRWADTDDMQAIEPCLRSRMGGMKAWLR